MSFCKICQATNNELFYASIKTYCKEHWKEKVRANRVAKIEHYRKFDQMRASMPHRVAARKEYQKTSAGKERHKAACSNWIAENPDRRKAHNILASALKRGEVTKQPCVICGSNEVEAHHASYDLPLEDHRYCGPIVINKAGDPLEVQPPEGSPFWDAVTLWYAQGKRTKDPKTGEIWCVWDKPTMQKMRHLGGRHYELVTDDDTPNVKVGSGAEAPAKTDTGSPSAAPQGSASEPHHED
jgi:hypothetical protein